MRASYDSFGTSQMNQASIASELDFNFENAEITSTDPSDSVDLE